MRGRFGGWNSLLLLHNSQLFITVYIFFSFVFKKKYGMNKFQIVVKGNDIIR